MNEQSIVIAKMCQECVQQTTDKCDGKIRGETQSGKKPCKKYEFDENLLSAEDTIICDESNNIIARVSENVVDKPEIKEVITQQRQQSKKLHNQIKADNFARLSAKRLDTTLDSIRKLSNLANPYVYQWTDKQAEEIVEELRTAIWNLEKDFRILKKD